ncbi:hypothetical protein ACUNV4_29495 [Granulosicoccus sp. 3-233]|uniref:hypothetical protein n=1 Tax=Granulosicoccus sp. 3-233 TaxID=3417969 RepID=UPI003D344578
MGLITFFFGDAATTTPLPTYAIAVIFCVIVFTTVIAIVKALALVEKWVVDGGGKNPSASDPQTIRRERYTLVGAITILTMAATFAVLMLWQSNVRAQALSIQKDEVTEQLENATNENGLLRASLEASEQRTENTQLALASLQTQLSDLDAQRASASELTTGDLEFQNSALQNEVDVLLYEVSALEDHIAILEENLKYEKETARYASEIASVDSQQNLIAEELTEAVEGYNALLAQYENDVGALDEKIDNLTTQLTQAQQTIEQYKQKEREEESESQ